MNSQDSHTANVALLLLTATLPLLAAEQSQSIAATY